MKKSFLAGVCGLMAASGFAEFQHHVTEYVSGYSGCELTNMPVLVRLPSSWTANCRADGEDIQFTSVDGETVYPHEIDVWNQSGESVVWVKLPTMRNGTSFKLNYGDPSYTGPAVSQAKGAVWDDAGYAGVWHMSEQSGNVANAASALGDDGVPLDAVPKGSRAQYSVRYSSATDADAANDPAPIGYARFTGARQSDNASNDRAYLEVPSYDCLELGGEFVLSGWVRLSEYVGGYSGFTRNGRIFARKTAYNSAGGFTLAYNRSSTELNLRGGSSTGNDGLIVGSFPNAYQEWVHVAFVFNGSTISAYGNGTLSKSGNLSNSIAATDNGLPLGIGSNVNTGLNNDSYIAGSFDEVRLMRRDADKSADYYTDWVRAEYDMVVNPNFLRSEPELPEFEVTQYALVAPFTVDYEWPVDATAADRENLPVLVRVSEGRPVGFSYDNCAADGSDITFCSADGRTEYAFDLDTWNPQGESCFWVRIPDASTAATFLMCYSGGQGEFSRARPESVWSDYIGVWHLGEVSGLAFDATGHGLNGTPSGKANGVNAKNIMVAYQSGVVGAARVNGTANGSSLTYMSVPSYDDYELGGTFTISGWFLANDISGYPRIFSRKTNYKDGNGFEIEVKNGSKTEATARGSGEGSIGVTWPDITRGWLHLSFVYEGNALTVYTNGWRSSSGTISAAQDNGNRLSFGNNSNGSEASFNGQYDEIRLSKGAKSAVRVAAECSMMRTAFATSTGANVSPFIEQDGLSVMCDLDEFASDITPANGFSVTIGVKELTGDVAIATPFGELTTADGRRFRVVGWELYETPSGGAEVLVGSDTGAANFTYEYTARTSARLVLKLSGYQAPKVLGPGEASGAGWFGLGDTVTLTASGDDFAGWFIGATRVSADAVYSYAFDGIVDVRAVFRDTANLVADAENPPAAAEGVFFETYDDVMEFAGMTGVDTINIYPGTYAVTNNAVLPAGLAFKGVKAADGTRPVIDFDATGSFTAEDGVDISGLRFANARSNSTPVTLRARARLTDCLFDGLTGYFYVVALAGADATIDSCTFTNCVSTSSGAGVITCSGGSPVYILDTTVDGCKHNVNGQYGGLFHIEGGANVTLTVRRCRVFDSSARNSVARIENGKMIAENCLFVRNSGLWTILACNGAAKGGTKFTNCTFLGNTGYAASPRCVYESCIIWDSFGDGGTIATAESGDTPASLSYCCYPEADGTDGNISADPQLTSACELGAGSSCVNAGNPNAAWTASDIDLAGNQRVRALRVDVGCFERQAVGLVILVR